MRTPKRIKNKIDKQVEELKDMLYEFELTLRKLKNTTETLDYMNRGMKGWGEQR